MPKHPKKRAKKAKSRRNVTRKTTKKARFSRIKPRKAVKKAEILPKKVVFLVIDGLADLPEEGRTPLSEARKPNLDWMAKNGVVGELDLVPKGLKVKSQVANAALLGNDPQEFYLNRGPLEAVGAGLPYEQGHLALRCNFATVDEELTITDRRAGRDSTGLDDLSKYVNEHVDIGAPFVLMRTYGHRGVLIIKMNLSDKISDSDPGMTGVKPNKVSALEPDAILSAKYVQDFIEKARKIIEYHPANGQRKDKGLPAANYMLTRDAGNRLQAFPNFNKRFKTKAVCISEKGVMKATCLLAGFDSVDVPEWEGLDFIFDQISDALAEYDFVYAHIKPVDEAGHDGDFQRKRREIEKIDEKLTAYRNFGGVLVVTCDHITSWANRRHEHGKVPVLVYGKEKGKIKTFDEMSATKGRLRNYSGKKLLKYIFSK